ncbi:hypothetical protein FEM48_Zijuj11G0145000 [Ziziphus jujuba var. spinosa]|uniref:Uncharacterized protein n=1 Tax=Ziziphus jujuba var. spinosa TaxID=714518 RepID=A0A978UJH2_ZIZJJ|nr:hypothetical protein FEM48_Zijuj11G0145000 [Ziziphus jujuba var. spinosa]
MRCLKYLSLDGCPNLEKLPEISYDCMSSSLELLKISGSTRLKSIPESIWRSSLKELTLSDCPKLEKLPEISYDCMSSSLELLKISGSTRLKSIPESIWRRSSLKMLTLSDCPNLEKLQEISDDCISSSIEDLVLSGCMRLKSVPESIWKMSSLKRLTLMDCPNLEKLPEILDDCMSSSVQELVIRRYGMENLPLNLQTLFLSGCTRLKSIPVLPSGLNILDASNCTSLETMSSWRDLMSSWRDLQQLEGTTEKCDFQKRQPYIFLEINFKTNVNSDDRLHGHYPILHTLFCDGGREIYGCLMEHDHVLIANAKLNLRDVFGEEWSSVCGNATEVSFRVSIRGAVVIDWEIKKFGLELVNMWGTASKNKRLFSECSGQPNGYQDEAHDPHINSKRIKAQQIIR